MTYCLIVEDFEISRDVFEGHIENLGIKQKSASNAMDALEFCKQEMPACIVLDWHMPGVDGFDFLASLRQLEDGDKPAIIMCTCDEFVGEKERIAAAKIDAVLTKPIHFEDLKHQLEKTGILPCTA